MIDLSDTPETDLLLSNQHHDCVPYDDSAGQLAELCFKLERERDEARKAFAIATTTCVDVQQRLRVLERQRNELQADRAHLIIIARDRLEKIRQLEREIEAATPLKSQISNLQSNP